MALTRSQLLAGDGSQGTVLSGQVQGVKQGVGVLILPDGTINFDSTTALGVVRLNNAGAYNAYEWPTLVAAPDAGTILQSNGAGGLLWTANYVTTTGATGSANLPVGDTSQRPVVPEEGQIRFNSEETVLEYYDGLDWVSDVTITSTTGAANLPVGVNSQRPIPAAAGQIRFNDEETVLEFYDGVAWVSVADAAAQPDIGLGLVLDGTTIKASTPIQFGPPTVGSQPTEAVDGSTYWDDNLGVMFVYYNDGTSSQWVQVIPS